MNFGALIIGDEILLGKRQDKHFPFLVEALTRRGLRLAYCEYLADDPVRITAVLRRTFASGDVVFSFGGIGATPDDHTRACAAAAAGVPLALHPEAEREIRGRFGADATPNRLAMGEFPAGAQIIPNPVNRIAGFSLGEHHFVPGFPQMARPMVEWVLDTRYAHLANALPRAESSVYVFEAGESQLTDLMYALEARYPGLKVFSLPSMGDDGMRRHIELGARGDPATLERAMGEMRAEIARRGFPMRETPA